MTLQAPRRNAIRDAYRAAGATITGLVNQNDAEPARIDARLAQLLRD